MFGAAGGYDALLKIANLNQSNSSILITCLEGFIAAAKSDGRIVSVVIQEVRERIKVTSIWRYYITYKILVYLYKSSTYKMT